MALSFQPTIRFTANDTPKTKSKSTKHLKEDQRPQNQVYQNTGKTWEQLCNDYALRAEQDKALSLQEFIKSKEQKTPETPTDIFTPTITAKTNTNSPVSQVEDESKELQSKPAANEVVEPHPINSTFTQEKKLQTKLDKATAQLREMEDWCAGVERDVKGYQTQVFSKPGNQGVISRVTDYLWGIPKSAILTVAEFKKGMRHSEYPKTQKYQEQLARFVKEIDTKAQATENETLKQQIEQFHQHAAYVQKRLAYHVDRQDEVITMMKAADEHKATHIKVFDNDHCPILLILEPKSKHSAPR